jgi:hypothetical protein
MSGMMADQTYLRQVIAKKKIEHVLRTMVFKMSRGRKLAVGQIMIKSS